MDIISTVRESLTLKELFQAHLVILILAGSLLPLSAQRHNDSLFLLLRWKRINVLWITGLVGIFFFARVWLALVDKYVPDPYLVGCLYTLPTLPATANSHFRMRSSISLKRRHIVRDGMESGMTR